VGREEEGSSSNRLELVVFVLALRGTPVTKPMLYLFDSQALLNAVAFGKMVRLSWKCDVSRSARRRHFTGSNWGAPKKKNSRSIDISGQGESASRRTCKCRSRHSSRQGNFKQRCSHGIHPCGFTLRYSTGILTLGTVAYVWAFVWLWLQFLYV